MALQVELSPHAAIDLEDIAAHIARDDPEAAARWVDQLAARALRVGTYPRAGRAVPEYREPTIREVFVGNYRIISRVEPTRILILKFVEGHRPMLRR